MPESQPRLDEVRRLMEVLAREYAALKADDPRRAEIIQRIIDGSNHFPAGMVRHSRHQESRLLKVDATSEDFLGAEQRKDLGADTLPERCLRLSSNGRADFKNRICYAAIGK